MNENIMYHEFDGKMYAEANDFENVLSDLIEEREKSEALEEDVRFYKEGYEQMKKRARSESVCQENDILQISLKRGDTITYQASSFTDYMIRDGLFVVIKETQWIGMYNMDCVEYVAYIPEDKIEQ